MQNGAFQFQHECTSGDFQATVERKEDTLKLHLVRLSARAVGKTDGYVDEGYVDNDSGVKVKPNPLSQVSFLVWFIVAILIIGAFQIYGQLQQSTQRDQEVQTQLNL